VRRAGGALSAKNRSIERLFFGVLININSRETTLLRGAGIFRLLISKTAAAAKFKLARLVLLDKSNLGLALSEEARLRANL
jgi:hypothetical protein